MKRNAFVKLEGNLLLGIAGPGLDWQIDMAAFMANKLFRYPELSNLFR